MNEDTEDFLPLLNNNCLAGVVCPKCDSEGPFDIVVTTTVRMHDDGSEHIGTTTEWENDAMTTCCDCAFRATMADFTTVPAHVEQLVRVPPERSGPITSVHLPRGRRLTVAEIEDSLGGRYSGEYREIEIKVPGAGSYSVAMISLEEHVRDAYPLNAKIQRRFGIDIRGPVLVLPLAWVKQS